MKTQNENTTIKSDNNWKSETIAQTRIRLRREWGDYPLTILIINPINLFLVKIVGRTSITPNQISFFSFFLTAVAACFLTSLNSSCQAIGGGFLLVGFLVDCLDGDLARLKNLKSPLGAMLDPILDRCGEIVIILGIAVNGWRMTDNPLWLLGGIILMGLSQLYFYITDAMLNIFRKEFDQVDNSEKRTLFGTILKFGAIEPFIWGQAFFAFIGVAYWGVFVFSIMFMICCIIQLCKLFTITRNIQKKDTEKFEVHVW